MARPFKSRDLSNLFHEYDSLNRQLIEMASLSDKYRMRIIATVDSIINKETMKVLASKPVEELNRDKRGIRVKLLHESGYKTIADIAQASEYSIASLRGISDDGARLIKELTTSFRDSIRNDIKIRLNADDRNQSSSELINAICQYNHAKTCADSAEHLLNSYNIRMTTLRNELSQAPKGGLGWIFASSKRKQASETSYNEFKKLLSGEYGDAARSVITNLSEIDSISVNDAWGEFTTFPIRFVNVLEEICPEAVGKSDATYGLPEDLAREIETQQFFPQGLLCDLRRYQEWGVKYILHQERVLLGDEMGLGKTVQAIASMVSLRNTGATHFMVVCPASVISNWCREIERLSRLKAIRIHGSSRQSAVEEWIDKGNVGVTTYETIASITLPQDFKFSMLTVDEAHYIKNPNAQRTVNVAKISRHTNRLLFMTGTALENNVGEMISLIQMLNPQIAIAANNMTALSSAPQFRNLIAPVYYRRKRETMLTELPELIESEEWCTMSHQEEVAYEHAVLSRNYAEARRVSWNIDDIKCSSKAKRLAEIAAEAKADNRKLIVFSFFLDTIAQVVKLLEGDCVSPINGSIPPQRRQEIIDQFDKAPAGAVLPAQIQSGGTGLNIQSASIVVICEPQFKPSIENQAIARAYRMKQTRNVLVYRLLCENTVDEKIMDMLHAKQEIFDAFADKSVAAAASNELDDSKFSNIIQQEIDRINAKNAVSDKSA